MSFDIKTKSLRASEHYIAEHAFFPTTMFLLVLYFVEYHATHLHFVFCTDHGLGYHYYNRSILLVKTNSISLVTDAFCTDHKYNSADICHKTKLSPFCMLNIKHAFRKIDQNKCMNMQENKLFSLNRWLQTLSYGVIIKSLFCKH